MRHEDYQHKCAHPLCPGYPFLASEVAHPCGRSEAEITPEQSARLWQKHLFLRDACEECGEEVDDGVKWCPPCLARLRDEDERELEEAREDYERGLR